VLQCEHEGFAPPKARPCGGDDERPVPQGHYLSANARNPTLCTLGKAPRSIRVGTAAKRECGIRRQVGYDVIQSWRRSLPARVAPSGPGHRTRGLPSPRAPRGGPCCGSGRRRGAI
jgi:hypothetical protein